MPTPADLSSVTAAEHRLIDVRHLGRPRTIGTWQIGDLLIDPGPESCSATLLKSVAEPPKAILLTHIHLDHAAATGALIEHWPGTDVFVHVRGARHLADPSRLLSSASQLYGRAMDALWGRIVPVPADRIHGLHGGEEVHGMRIAATPGHATHHVSYLHEESGWAFVGDVAGVRIDPASLIVMPTPPPDIDLPAWKESLAVIRAWSPTALALTHFGHWEDVDSHLDVAEETLMRWAERSRQLDAPAFHREIVAEIDASCDGPTAAAYKQAAPTEHLYPGLERYFAQSERLERGAE